MRGTLAGYWFDLSDRSLAIKHGLTREGFIGWALDNADMEAIQVDGRVVGIMAINDNYIHVAVEPGAPKPAWHLRFKAFVKKQLAKHGHLIAMTDATDQRARRFIERSGCLLQSDNGVVAEYILRPENAWFKGEMTWAD